MNTLVKNCLKILHIPCNTAYIKKIIKEKEIQIINGMRYLKNQEIPFEITYSWIVEHKDDSCFWDSFDICHLHYGFEFESIEIVTKALELLKAHQKPIVYTCHELHSVHGISEEDYRQYIILILEYADSVVTLTDSANIALSSQYQRTDVITIPHGFVAHPQIKELQSEIPEVIFFGAVRPNREMTTTLVNTILSIADSNVRITWLTRPFTVETLEDSAVLRLALDLLTKNSNANIELTLPLTDKEVFDRISEADIIALPYVSGGHSGQLELAYDCGVLPVITNVGFFSDQYNLHLKSVTDIPVAIEVDWSDGKSWLYQVRFLQGLKDALKLLPVFKKSLNWEQRQSFRIKEYKDFLNKYITIYQKVTTRKEKVK